MTVYYGSYYGNSLQHHGIKGMKWGVRRFQNEDGTYTDEGRRRYGFKDRLESFKESYNKRQDYKKAKKIVEGEKRRKNGETILGTKLQSKYTAILAASAVTYLGYEIAKKHISKGSMFIDGPFAGLPVANLDVGLTRIGRDALAIGILASGAKKVKQMRAYDNATNKERKLAREKVASYEKKG